MDYTLYWDECLTLMLGSRTWLTNDMMTMLVNVSLSININTQFYSNSSCSLTSKAIIYETIYGYYSKHGFHHQCLILTASAIQ